MPYKEKKNLDGLVKKLRSGDRNSLGKAITLIESSLTEDKNISKELLKRLLPHASNSLRIGITGIPGSGKSTFIDAFGSFLIEKCKRKIAVLTIDPSSEKSKGSILGDKTRMEKLSKSNFAFIRPSPNKAILGGVSQKTKESILLCEASGYDTILIETVGIGQSEIEVERMVDFLIMMQLVGAGDSLQMIKRGVFEKINLLLINKAEQERLQIAKIEAKEFKQSFKLFRQKESSLNTEVLICSSIEKTGFKKIWEFIDRFISASKKSNYFLSKRKDQNIKWFDKLLTEKIYQLIASNEELKKEIEKIKKQIKNGGKNPIIASQKIDAIFQDFFSTKGF